MSDMPYLAIAITITAAAEIPNSKGFCVPITIILSGKYDYVLSTVRPRPLKLIPDVKLWNNIS